MRVLLHGSIVRNFDMFNSVLYEHLFTISKSETVH